MSSALRFFSSSIGKKMLMAVSGIFVSIFILGHLAGNLQLFLGPDALNEYGLLLRANMPLLYIFRTVMIIALIVHVYLAITLTLQNNKARPVSYKRRAYAGAATFGSRTLIWTGILIFLFVIIHLAHYTFGTFNPEWDIARPGHNLLESFAKPLIALPYVGMMIVLGFHLSHVFKSLFQSLGLSHPQYTPKLEKVLPKIGWLVCILYALIPLSVLFGII